MRVLHLNTHASGGSYEYAALLTTALAQHGIESHVLCKNSQSAETGRLLLDRIVRRSYVSLSTEPWHGTRRLLSPPASEDLRGVDVVHLHTVADWFDVPRWLNMLPREIGVVISLHDMWHVTGGCFLYRGCDRYANETHPCNPCPILRWPANRFLAKAPHSRKLQAYRNCGARMVANSHWLAEIAARSPIAKACGSVRVIPAGIDTAVFKPQDKNLPKKSGVASRCVCHRYRRRVADGCKQKCAVVVWATVAFARPPGCNRFGIRRRHRSGSGGFERAVYRWHLRTT